MSKLQDYYNGPEDGELDLIKEGGDIQVFTASESYTLSKISLQMRLYIDSVNPGQLKVSIVSVGIDGTPTFTVLSYGMMNTTDFVIFPNPPEWYEVTLNTPLPISIGIKYGIFCDARENIEGSNVMWERRTFTGGYPGGEIWSVYLDYPPAKLDGTQDALFRCYSDIFVGSILIGNILNSTGEQLFSFIGV